MIDTQYFSRKIKKCLPRKTILSLYFFFFEKIGFVHSPLLVAVLSGNSFEKREEIEKQTGIHMFVNFADQKITLFGQPEQHKRAKQKFDEILAVINLFLFYTCF